jgi:hypothetical protein
MVSVLVARKTARGKEKKSTKKSVAPGSQVNGGNTPERSVFDFFALPSAAGLARAQGVGRIRKPGQIRGFSDPDPKEAEWFARQVRIWRRDTRPRVAGR